MYEIWLALNIVWEIGLRIWPVLLAAALLWLLLMGLALSRPGPARPGGRPWGRRCGWRWVWPCWPSSACPA